MTKAKRVSIGAAMKGRMETSAAEAVTQAPAAESEALEQVNSRLRAGLYRRLKLFAVGEGRRMQDVLSEALEEYLDRRGG